MTQDYVPARVLVVVGSPWRDAVFALLGAPLQPWPSTDDATVVVIDSAPRLVLTALATAGPPHSVVPLTDIETAMGWSLPADDVLEGDRVGALLAVLDKHRWRDTTPVFGHSTLAAAETLLTSEGRCTGCWAEFDLQTAAGRDAVQVRTVGGNNDWPAALCTECQRSMADRDFTNFLDYRFSRHPRCP
ncbi:hypothetical protein [Mycobacterium sp. C31M]